MKKLFFGIRWVGALTALGRVFRIKYLTLLCAMAISLSFNYQPVFADPPQSVPDLVYKWIEIKEFHVGTPWLFTMGANDDATTYPERTVTIDYGIEMWRTEVTAAEYAKCISEEGCKTPLLIDGHFMGWDHRRWAFFGGEPTAFYGTYNNGDGVFSAPTGLMIDAEDNETDLKIVDLHWNNGKFEDGYGYPMNFVTWEQACEFCEWLGEQEQLMSEDEDADDFFYQVRLPSEAEWEFAAKNGGREDSESNPYKYPWGNDEADACEKAVTKLGGNVLLDNEDMTCGWFDKTAWFGYTWPFFEVNYDEPDDPGYKEPVWPYSYHIAPVCSLPEGNTRLTDFNNTPWNELCDMAGNIWEFTLDDRHYDYTPGGWNGIEYVDPVTVAPLPVDGSPWLEDEPKNEIILRSGCAFYDTSMSNNTVRYGAGGPSKFKRTDYDHGTGFRCIRVKKPMISNFPYYQSFETDWREDWRTSWKNVVPFEWTRRSGSTPSYFTGPSSAQDGNYYVYTEATSNNNEQAVIEGPVFNLANVSQPVLSFWYHMDGQDMGDLFVKVNDNEVNPNEEIGISYWETLDDYTISGNQGTGWTKKEVNLSDYIGKNISIRFHAITGNNYRSDIAIDSIEITGVTGAFPGEPCDSEMIYDCALNCVNASTAAAWTGDGYCDNGTWGYVLTCPEFNNDGGDCD